jgi:hypothetical protein
MPLQATTAPGFVVCGKAPRSAARRAATSANITGSPALCIPRELATREIGIANGTHPRTDTWGGIVIGPLSRRQRAFLAKAGNGTSPSVLRAEGAFSWRAPGLRQRACLRRGPRLIGALRARFSDSCRLLVDGFGLAWNLLPLSANTFGGRLTGHATEN